MTNTKDKQKITRFKMSKLLGQATESSTKNYADKIWQNNPKISPNTWRIMEGLTVSKIGFGSYRTNGNEENKAALKKALLNGVNLIDTSINYMDSESEKFIGETLTDLCEKNFINREEVVIITKGGYLQSEHLLEAEESGIEEIVKVNDQLWHSIHPTNLEKQLNQSLDNLNLETIDGYLIHNPEYFIGHALAQTGGERTEELEKLYYGRIEKAFEFLEKMVQEGKIAFYGVSSNTFGVERQQGDHTNLARVFEAAQNAAQKAWGRKKRPMFRMIELPINIMELGALKNVNTTAHIVDGTEEVSTLELASRMNLAVLANRPLNAFPMSGGIFRLSDSYNREESDLPELDLIFDEIKATETALNKGLNGWPSVDEQSMFSFTAHGEDLLEQVTNSVQLDHMDMVFLTPHIAMMQHVLFEISAERPELKEPLDMISENFAKQAGQLLKALRKDMRQKDAENIQPLELEVRDRVAEEWKDAPLQQLAMNAIASIPGVTTVLCGLRRESYVDDAIQTFEKGDFIDPARVIGAQDFLETEEFEFGEMEASAS